MASNINENDNDVKMTYSDEYTVVSSTGTAGYNMLNKSNNNNKVTNHNNLPPPQQQENERTAAIDEVLQSVNTTCFAFK